MRRSICFCEPSYALAGDLATWRFVYTTAALLPKGTRIKFDIESKGKFLDWELPSSNPKDKKNIIFLETPQGKEVLPLKQSASSCSFEFSLPSEVKIGESIAILLKENGAQKIVQRKRPFYLYVDPKGKGEYKEKETFFLDIRGNHLKTLRIVAPSIVSRNKRFDVIVRFEDSYGNLTSNAPDGTLIDLSYQNLRENLNWKLFVPETGFIALPNLYFNEPGIYKIQLKNLKTEEQFFSPPIKCLPEGALSLYWGVLHGESTKTGSKDNIDTLLRHVRDDRSLQFFATSCFDSEEETSNETWKVISSHIAEFNEEDRFVAILGFLWLGDPSEEGLRQFLYSKDMKPIMRKKDTKHNSLKKIYKTSNPKEMVSIPSLTMAKSIGYNFEDFNPEFERVVEIYNSWGSSECLEKEGNKHPIQGGKRGLQESSEGSLRKALNQGCRFGFVSGGLDERGPFHSLLEEGQKQYPAGLTAILSKEHNRASLIEALQNRSCYATTGERMILGLHIAGQSMGSEIDTKSRPGLEFNRHITGYCIGTQPIEKAELIRNGKVFRTFKPNQDGIVEFEVDDMELLSEISLLGKEPHPAFSYYYFRAEQKDGHVAWSSPIWVDLIPKSSSSPAVKKVKKKSKEL